MSESEIMLHIPLELKIGVISNKNTTTRTKIFDFLLSKKHDGKKRAHSDSHRLYQLFQEEQQKLLTGTLFSSILA
jgi:hypothetical protein